jgi:hypothetical protein
VFFSRFMFKWAFSWRFPPVRAALRFGFTAFVVLGFAASAFAQTTSTPAPAKPVAPAAKAAPKSAAAKNVMPPAIDAAFKKAYPNAMVKNVSKEKGKDGKDEYEVESVDAGLNRDLVYHADGTVVEYEEQVPAASVPAPVMASVTARYPKATVTKAEKLFKDGTTNFELALKGAGVAEVELTPDGKWISPKPAVKK